MKKNNKAPINFGYALVRPLVRLFALVTMYPIIYHKERIPKKGPIIFAGTHTSKFDFITVGCLTIRPVHFLTKKELYDTFKPFFKFMGLIRVDRSRSNPEAKEMAISALEDNKVICVFPEGTINKTDDYIMPFKKGAASFAIKTGAPVVPFAIINKTKLFKSRPIIYVGEPYNVKSDDLEKETKILENKVIELIKEGKNEQE